MDSVRFSDRRLKKNIVKIAEIKGINIYEFEYNHAVAPEIGLPEGKFIGVMADEVKHIPKVVLKGHNGYDMVDYEALRRHWNMEFA